ncbi:MAG: cbb3-type cytochrome oxidase assembly protein CcoS [Bacteroidia bacterium]
MSAIIILIVLSLVVALGFLAAFLWAVKSGQFDDDYTPAVRMLFEEKIQNPNTYDQESHPEHRTGSETRPD